MNEATPNMMQDQGPERPGAVNPTALPITDAARLLSAAGGQQITVEMLEADVAAGAPTNADGTINLVHYAAWLVLDMSRLAARDRSQSDLGEADATCQGLAKEMSTGGN